MEHLVTSSHKGWGQERQLASCRRQELPALHKARTCRGRLWGTCWWAAHLLIYLAWKYQFASHTQQSASDKGVISAGPDFTGWKRIYPVCLFDCGCFSLFFFFFCLICLFRSNLRCRDYEPENSTGNGNAVMSQAVIHPEYLWLQKRETGEKATTQRSEWREEAMFSRVSRPT